MRLTMNKDQQTAALVHSLVFRWSRWPWATLGFPDDFWNGGVRSRLILSNWLNSRNETWRQSITQGRLEWPMGKYVNYYIDWFINLLLNNSLCWLFLLIKTKSCHVACATWWRLELQGQDDILIQETKIHYSSKPTEPIALQFINSYSLLINSLTSKKDYKTCTQK